MSPLDRHGRKRHDVCAHLLQTISDTALAGILNMRQRMKRSRHVGILLETEDAWGRNLVESICRFGQRRRWSVLIARPDPQGRVRLQQVWDGDGVIAALRNRNTIRHVQNLGLPVVDGSATLRKNVGSRGSPQTVALGRNWHCNTWCSQDWNTSLATRLRSEGFPMLARTIFDPSPNRGVSGARCARNLPKQRAG